MRRLFKRPGYSGCLLMTAVISLTILADLSLDNRVSPVLADFLNNAQSDGQSPTGKPAKDKQKSDGQIENTSQQIVRTAGNSIYRVFVDDFGLYTATTGPAHPAGNGLNVLFGDGSPGTTFNTIRSYTSGRDYLQTNDIAAGNTIFLGSFASVTPIGTTGFRTTYVLPGGSTTPDSITIIQDVNVNGTTFNDSTIEVTTTINNTGAAPVDLGIRYLWDYQIASDDGPTFQEIAPDNAVRINEAQFAPPGFTLYRIVDNDQNPSPPTFFILGTAAGPVTLSPPPISPGLLQYTCWPTSFSTVFDYQIDPTREIATTNPNSRCGNDTAVLYYFGQNRANAITLPPGGSRTVSASMFLITAAGADLSISQSASPDTVTPGSNVTYTIRITNNDSQNAARFVTVNDNLPASVNFVSCSSTGSGVCSGTGNNRAVSFPSLPPGSSETITLVASANGVVCSTDNAPTITNTATVSASTPDPNLANNSSTTVVNLTGSGSSGLPISVNKSSIDFGTVAAARVLSANPPGDTFTINNPGCAPALLNFFIDRTGNDVANGRIVNSDDSALFQLQIIGPGGSQTPVPIGPGAAALQIPPGQSSTFRILFNPLIPILAGKTTGLFANQVLPDVINSQLRITNGGGTPLVISLIGRIATPLKLIHPMDSRLAPLILFTRSGNEFTVECSTHDSNLDLYLARYQFLEQSGGQVGSPVDVDLTQPIAQRDLVRGQSFSIIQKFTGASNRPEINKVQVILFDRESIATADPAVLGAVQPVLASVSAASFSGAALASESIVSSFGNGLAPGVQSASTDPLPTSLAGVSVLVRDGAGIERPSRLFFVSPTQINFQIPAGTMVGAGTVTVVRDNQVAARQSIQFSNTSPGLFSANANGQGVAAAVALRVDGKGRQSYESVSKFDQSQNRFVSRPLDPASPGTELYLVLFGTGIRFPRSSANVVVRIGGIDVPASYAGAQGGFVGLDQVNVLVPPVLAGRGEVDVAVIIDGTSSNPVRVRFGGASAIQSVVAENQEVDHQSTIYQTATSITLPTLKLTPRDRASRVQAQGGTRRSGGPKE